MRRVMTVAIRVGDQVGSEGSGGQVHHLDVVPLGSATKKDRFVQGHDRHPDPVPTVATDLGMVCAARDRCSGS
jgi:hypothetical protein